MLKPKLIATLALTALPLVAAADPVVSTAEMSSAPLSANIPSALVIGELSREFDEARPVLATGDLHLDSRWMCRELFTSVGGSSNYRFKSLKLRYYDGAMIEDALGVSPRLYVFTRDGLFGNSAQTAGVTTEIRVDNEGNLRLAERDLSGHVRSYTVCLKRNRAAD